MNSIYTETFDLKNHLCSQEAIEASVEASICGLLGINQGELPGINAPSGINVVLLFITSKIHISPFDTQANCRLTPILRLAPIRAFSVGSDGLAPLSRPSRPE